MAIKINTERSEIIDSGSIIVPANEYVQFEVEDLRFRFSFIHDDNSQTSSFTSRLEDGMDGKKVMTIQCTNMEHSLFATPTNELQLARTREGKLISLRFSIVSLIHGEPASDEEKLMFYTWYKSNNQNEQ